MNSSYYERHVPLQEKPRSMNHTFLKIIRWRNSRQTKIKSISCHLISLVTRFPTSQNFCNSDFVWESYANFSEDSQKFLCKTNCSSAAKKPQTNLHEFTSLLTSLIVFGCLYIHIKMDMFHAGRLVFTGKSGKNLNF